MPFRGHGKCPNQVRKELGGMDKEKAGSCSWREVSKREGVQRDEGGAGSRAPVRAAVGAIVGGAHLF